MTTPNGPQHEGQPDDQGSYGGPPVYGGQQPGQYGGPPREQPGQYGHPAQGQPGQYGGQQPYPAPTFGGNAGAYGYNPYGQPYPVGPEQGGEELVPRPGGMIGGLVMLILSALPFLALGVGLLVLPVNAASLGGVLDNPQLAQAGLTPESLLSAVRVIAGILAVLALLYIVFAIIAFRGRNWARIVLTIMTVVFAIFLGLSLVGSLSGGAAASTSVVFTLVILILSVGGTVLLYVGDAKRFFAQQRR